VFDRFTLDEVSAKIWWPLAMVALVAMVLTVPAANHAADRARRESAATAMVISAKQIEPLTSSGASIDEISSALAQIQRANPVYDAVRVWSTDKLLIASSVRPDPLAGGTAGVNDADIDGAMSTGWRMDVTNRLPTGDTGPVVVHTFVKIDGATQPEVTEFEANDAALLAQVHHDWNGYRIVAAAAFLLLLLLALLSMREPVADIGVGVPFYPASLPPNLAIVDAERAVLIEHEDDHVRQRVAGLQQRLDESERQRLKAEAQLQQALTTLGTGGRNVPGLPPEPPTPTLPAGRRAKPAVAASTPPPASATPTVVPMTPAAGDAPAAASTSGKRADKKRSSRRQKPAAERTPTPRRSRADEPSEAPPPPVTTPERVMIAADDVTVTAQPAAASAAKAPVAKEERPEVVVLPSEKPAPVGAPSAKTAPVKPTTPVPAPQAAAPTKAPAPTRAAPTIGTAPAQPSAAAAQPDPGPDILDRLGHDDEAQPLDDPGDLRARLARTAALKKPGSKERQDQREGLQHRPSEQ
jgi:hypothetical protein